MAHTPGPWKVSADVFKFERSGYVRVMSMVSTKGREICDVPIADCGYFASLGDIETSEANARLIAAAPEMFAMLEVIESDYTDVRALLAKIRGA